MDDTQNQSTSQTSGASGNDDTNQANQNVTPPPTGTPDQNLTKIPSESEPTSTTTPARTADEGAQAQQSVSDDEYLQLKTELEQTQTKLKEMMAISQHALADLQNYKRRAEDDRANFIQYANSQILLDFLPALNNVERALQHEPKDLEWTKGIEQIFKQFSQILEKQNVKPIPTVGQTFDPKLHEALMTGPGAKDTVVAEFEKGYLIGDRILKPARVKVGNGETEAPSES